jgi:hypothetical protein
MALVNIATIIADTRRALKKIAPPGGIELLSYKRNRSIAIIKKTPHLLLIREHGYEEQEFELPTENLTKELKILIKREFPRSRKVRLLKFSDPQELERSHQKI